MKNGEARVGSVAGKYRVVRLVGSGGMGTVYEALHVGLGKRVALKFVELDRSPDALVRFHREAHAIAAVESPHIVQVFDTGETDAGEPYLVLELLAGEDLAQRLRRVGRLALAEALAVVTDTLRGLRRAHAAGIVHRDLKPENLFLVRRDDERDHVKIVDFGLSKLHGKGADPEASGRAPSGPPAAITQDGALLGTPLYMAPEQLEGRADVDHRADLWSVGAILYETLVGAPPFPETSYARLVVAVTSGARPRPLRELAPAVPAAVTRAVERALDVDRARRFQTAEEFLDALLEAAGAKAPQLGAESGAAPSAPVSGGAGQGSRPSAPGSGPSSSQAMQAAAAVAPAIVDASATQAPGATMWLSQAVAVSLWRGEVAAADRLRVEGRDGAVHELRLGTGAPVAGQEHKLGRTERVGDERNDLVYPDVASRLAAVIRHDGVRWWLLRRDECSVPVQVGPRAVGRGEQAPLVHGVVLSVGGMRATFADRRYLTPAVPVGAVDSITGLLGRGGLEQEIASALGRKRPATLLLVRGPAAIGAGVPSSRAAVPEYAPLARLAVDLHRSAPSHAILHDDGTVAVLVPGEERLAAELGAQARELAGRRGLPVVTVGTWPVSGESLEAGRELELALHAIAMRADAGATPGVVALREATRAARLVSAGELSGASRDERRATLLFAIEEQNALAAVGPQVVEGLEKELCAVVASHAGGAAVVGALARGVVGAVVSRKGDPTDLGAAVQCDWHGRPPILDGKVELPRTLSWEVLHGPDAKQRATELARECADPHGVLSALSGGLPYPIAGRVHTAIAASSSVERVKVLFDVLEGIWRFIATVLASAYFAKRVSPGEVPAGFDQMQELARRLATRDGLAMGTWRELGRIAARGFPDASDPIGALARDVLSVKLSANQTFETLSNLMQAERNAFAHGSYGEARAVADLPEFEQMTRTLLRALRPLCAWTLVTVEKTEPDLYGEMQSVEFVDHTGPMASGTRRRIGLNSPVRLANVTYLARWREGLVLPLDPLLRRMPCDDRYELYWMDHLPRPGTCTMSLVVGGGVVKVPCDARRLPPLLRTLAGG